MLAAGADCAIWAGPRDDEAVSRILRSGVSVYSLAARTSRPTLARQCQAARPLIRHWDGSAWKVAPFPGDTQTVDDLQFNQVAAAGGKAWISALDGGRNPQLGRKKLDTTADQQRVGALGGHGDQRHRRVGGRVRHL
jgi:hypothetical protein